MRGLLDDRPLREWPSGRVLWLLFAATGMLIALHAAAVHRAVERALGVLGGQS